MSLPIRPGDRVVIIKGPYSLWTGTVLTIHRATKDMERRAQVELSNWGAARPTIAIKYLARIPED